MSTCMQNVEFSVKGGPQPTGSRLSGRPLFPYPVLFFFMAFINNCHLCHVDLITAISPAELMNRTRQEGKNTVWLLNAVAHTESSALAWPTFSKYLQKLLIESPSSHLERAGFFFFFVLLSIIFCFLKFCSHLNINQSWLIDICFHATVLQNHLSKYIAFQRVLH